MKTKQRPEIIDGVLFLPDWTYSGGDDRVPHRHSVIAQFSDGKNKFFVCSNKKRSLFWVHSTGDGFAGDGCSRTSLTRTTRKPELAAQWAQLVNAGNVRIKE